MQDEYSRIAIGWRGIPIRSDQVVIKNESYSLPIAAAKSACLLNGEAKYTRKNEVKAQASLKDL